MFQQKNQRRICWTSLLWIPIVEHNTVLLTSHPRPASLTQHYYISHALLYLVFNILLTFKLSSVITSRKAHHRKLVFLPFINFPRYIIFPNINEPWLKSPWKKIHEHIVPAGGSKDHLFIGFGSFWRHRAKINPRAFLFPRVDSVMCYMWLLLLLSGGACGSWCQYDRAWSQLGDGPLSMPVGDSLDYFNWC